MPRTVQKILDQADELARRFEDYEPADPDQHRAEARAAVHRTTLARAQSEAALANAVTQARKVGVTWASIGRLVGTSGEAARQRYGHRKAS